MNEPREHSPEETSGGDDAPTDDWLEEILAGYIDRLNAGERILPEEVLFEHPDSAEEILFQLESALPVESHSGSNHTSIVFEYFLRYFAT